MLQKVGLADLRSSPEGLVRLLGKLRGPFVVRGQSEECFAHDQCLLWTPECFEVNGQFRNAEKAIARGAKQRCALCRREGATLGCHVRKCRRSFHVLCALVVGPPTCTLDPKRFLLSCSEHTPPASHPVATALGV
eukprot:RCo000018